jgi:hypothetical protein
LEGHYADFMGASVEGERINIDDIYENWLKTYLYYRACFPKKEILYIAKTIYS